MWMVYPEGSLVCPVGRRDQNSNCKFRIKKKVFLGGSGCFFFVCEDFWRRFDGQSLPVLVCVCGFFFLGGGVGGGGW